MKIIRNNLLLSASLGIALTCLAGCTTMNPYTGESQINDTSKGAGIGAVGGALVGALVDGGKGALIGGTMGAIAGGAIGNAMDRENEELRQRLTGTGVQVRKTGNSVQLTMASDVTFVTNQADVQANFYPVLDSVAIVLKKYDNTSITVTGYTDNTGTAAYNQTLSERRAKSVGSYLISQGINPNRIFTQGMGMRDPVASNATAAGRSANRRVVITLRPLP